MHVESSHHSVSGPVSSALVSRPNCHGIQTHHPNHSIFIWRHENNAGWQFRVSCVCRIFPSLPASVLPRVSPPSLYSSLVSFFTCSSLVVVCCLFHHICFFVFVFLCILIFIFHIRWCPGTHLATVTCSTRHTSPHRALQDTALIMSTSTNKQRHIFRCKYQYMWRTIKPSKQSKTKRIETIEGTHGVAAYFEKDDAKTEPHVNTH